MWCSAADTHHQLLDRAVRGARFLTGGVFECDIAHRKFVAVVVVVEVGQTVGSISSKTLAYDCLCTLELFRASIATS